MSDIKILKNRRKEIIRRIELTEARKQEILTRKLDKETTEKWLSYYDNYIKVYKKHLEACENEIKKQKLPKEKKVIYILIFSILIISILIFISIFPVLKPLGLKVKDIGEKISFEKFFAKEKAPEEALRAGAPTPKAPERPAREPEVSIRVLEPPEEFKELEIPISLENKQVGISEESLIQYQAVLGKSVRWKKQFTTDSLIGFTIELPKGSENIKVNKIEDGKKQDITEIAGINKKFFSGKLEVGISNKAIAENAISDSEKQKYEIEYETSAPEIEEEVLGEGKRVIIKGSDEAHYKNVLSFTELPKELTEQELGKFGLYEIRDNRRIETQFTAYDTNENGLYDYIEWITPYLSEAEFLWIIRITKAQHLDENKTFISDIYNETYQLDGNWSEPIYHNEYIRVTFERPLDNTRDITLYPRVVSGNPKIEVYEIDGSEKIVEFTEIKSNEYNKVYLTNLPEWHSQDVFDLRVIGGSVEFDYIVDPWLQLFPGSITTCGWFNASGTYILQNNVYPDAGDIDCFSAYENNIVLDLNNKKVIGDYYNNWNNLNGVFVNGSVRNFSVKNGEISGFMYAVVFYYGVSNSKINNVTMHDNDVGVGLFDSSNNTIENVETYNNTYDGIYISDNSNRNILKDVYSHNNYGDFGVGILIETSSNNTIIDSDFSSNNLSDVYVYVYSVGLSLNNTFLNVTYNSSKEFVFNISQLIRKWYYQANVTYNNQAVNKANLSAYNRTNGWQFNLTSNSTGFTNITSIIDYINIGNVITGINRSYYSLYTINTINGSLSESHKLNVTLASNNSGMLGFGGLIWEDINLLKETEVAGCRNLDKANTYYTQAANIISGRGNDNCINITAQNITLDCAGKYIYLPLINKAGIYSNQKNTTIKNCNVSMGISGGYGIYLQGANNSYVFNNSLNEQFIGIYLYQSSNNVLINLTADNNSVRGIWLYSSSNNLLTNFNVNLNDYGVSLDSSSNNILTDFNANSNDNAGILMAGSSNNKIINSYINDSLNIYAVSLNNTFLNVTYNISKEDVSFNSQLIRKWYYQANVSYNGQAVANANLSAYNITGIPNGWQFNLTSNSSGYTNITTIIDYISNGTRNYYSLYTINTNNISLSESHKLNVTLASNNSGTGKFGGLILDNIAFAKETDVTKCRNLTLANTYYNLTKNLINENVSLVSPNGCIDIQAQNITFDCKGFAIINSSLNKAGVYSNQLNTTIKNCNISMGTGEITSGDGGYGIYLYNADNSYIFNNTLNNQNTGIYLDIGTSNTTIENNTANSNSRNIKIGESSHYNILINNNLWDCKDQNKGCLYFVSSGNNIISGGIINKSINNLIYLSGGGGSQNNVFKNLQLYGSAKEAVYITDNSINNTFDNLTIISDASNSGIFSNSFYTTIKNSNISMGIGGYGIYLNGTNNSYIFNNILNEQDRGLHLLNTHNTKIENNTLNSNQNYGIKIEASSNNTLINNKAWNCTTIFACLYFDNADNNTISGGIVNLSSNNLIYLKSESENNKFENIKLYNSVNESVYVSASKNNVFDNLTIISDFNATGIFSNSINTTIKNSNISMGSGDGGNGIYLYNADNSYVFNNVLNEQDRGLHLFNTSNTKIENNTLNSNQNYGIKIETSSKNTLINNKAWNCTTIFACLYFDNADNNTISGGIVNLSSNNLIYLKSKSENNKFENIKLYNSVNDSVYVLDSKNNVFDNLTIISEANYSGLYSDSANTTIKNSNISMGSGNGGKGIDLSNADNSYVYNNILNEQYVGLSIEFVHYSKIEKNTLNLNINYGIKIKGGSEENNITDNIVNSNIEQGIGLRDSNNNLLVNNTANSNNESGIRLWNSSNNVIFRGVINTSTSSPIGSIGIYIKENPNNNNFFRDINIIGQGNHVKVESNNLNNTFLNVTYDNSGNKEYVDSGSQLIRKWYYQANVSYNNLPVNNSKLSAYNRTNGWQFNLTSNSTGYTNITTIIDYINNGTRNYYSLYTISTTNGSLSEQHQLNVTLASNNSGMLGFGGLIFENIVLSVAPKIGIKVIYPSNLSETFNATKYEFFNVTLNITCLAGNCGNINVTLDPFLANQINQLKEFKNNKLINIQDFSSFQDSSNFQNSPRIINAKAEPDKVLPGDIMTVTAEVEDSSGIESVKAEMPHEKGKDILNLELVNGTIYNGLWQEKWNVHDTIDKEYASVITATNVFGESISGEVVWWDAYCEMSGCSDGADCGDIFDTWISRVKFNTINNPSSNSSIGYENFTSMSTNVIKGDNYALNVTIKSKLVIYSNGRVFIDFNQNSVLNDSGENFLIGYCESSTECNISTTIAIPNNALSGSTRMRIIEASSYVDPENPCANYSDGEAEDYTIIIEGEKGIINTTIGAKPFYTNASTNPLTTSSLIAGQSEIIIFWVNATGDAGIYEFFAYANLTKYLSVSNITSKWNVSILGEIVDTTSPWINFTFPTPPNNTITTNISIGINISIIEQNLREMKFNWNKTNYTIYDDSLVLMYNFDNVSALGESYNNTEGYVIKDLSRYGNNGTAWANGASINGPVWNSTGKYGGAFEFDGNEDYVEVADIADFNGGNQTFVFWANPGTGAANGVVLGKRHIGGADAWKGWFIFLNSSRLHVEAQSVAGTNQTDLYTNNDFSGWNHFAVIINSNSNDAFKTNSKLYVNGVLYNLTANDSYGSGFQGLTDTSVPLLLGAIGESTHSWFFKGSIDEIRIYNRSLSKDEIKQNYYSNLKKYDIDKWEFYTNETIKEPYINATYTYYGYAKDIIGNSNRTETRYLNILGVAPAINFTEPTLPHGNITNNNFILVNVSASDVNRGNSDISVFIDFNNSLVGWWRMDDVNQTTPGAKVYDFTGKNNGTAIGNAIQGQGYLGKGFEFDGDGDYIYFPAGNVSADVAGKDLTVMLWVKPGNATENEEDFVSFSENKLRLTKRNSKLDIFDGSWESTVPLVDGNWYFVSYVFNGTGGVVYVNGSNVYNYPSNLSIASNDLFSIGQEYDSGSPSNFLNGSIDDVMVFSRALSQEEVIALYANTSEKYLFHNFTNLASGNYTFKAYAQDLAGNLNWTETREVKIIGPPKVTLEYPFYSDILNQTQNIAFKCSATGSEGLKNITLYGFNSTNWNANQTQIKTGTSNFSIFYLNLTDNRTYEWNCLACDNLNACSFASYNYTFTIDTSYPTYSDIWIPTQANHSDGTVVTALVNASDSNTRRVDKDENITVYSWDKNLSEEQVLRYAIAYVKIDLAEKGAKTYIQTNNTGAFQTCGSCFSGENSRGNLTCHLTISCGINTNDKVNNLKLRTVVVDASTPPGPAATSTEDFIWLEVAYKNKPKVYQPKTYDNATLLEKTFFAKGDGIFINVSVTDFEGRDDISKVNITILNASNRVIVNNASMSKSHNITINNQNGSVYNYTWQINSTSGGGNWAIKIFATDKAGNIGYNTTNFSVNLPPRITWVQNISNITYIAGGITNISFNFTAYDIDGNLNDSSVKTNFTKGIFVRNSTSLGGNCSKIASWGNYANFSCRIGMWYYDAPGAWNVSVSIADNFSEWGVNSSTWFNYPKSYAFDIFPKYVNWTNVPLGQDRIADNNMSIINFGNQNISKLSVNITQLNGTQNTAYNISASNFTVNISTTTVCSNGYRLNESQNITFNFFINYSDSSGYTPASKNISFCLKSLSGIPAQEYKSARDWLIDVVEWQLTFILIKINGLIFAVAAVSIKRKKKKKDEGKEKSGLEINEKLKDKYIDFDSLLNLDESLREKYGLGVEEILEIAKEKAEKIKEIKEIAIPLFIFKQEISPAEVLCKYLKENLSLRFREIAKLLNRDERTIWINYRDACKKKKEKIKEELVEKEEIREKLIGEKIKAEDKIEEAEKKMIVSVSVEIFSDRKLSVLESVVKYLKEKGLRNIEIAEMLGKEQRNVYTLYMRARRKLGR